MPRGGAVARRSMQPHLCRGFGGGLYWPPRWENLGPAARMEVEGPSQPRTARPPLSSPTAPVFQAAVTAPADPAPAADPASLRRIAPSGLSPRLLAWVDARRRALFV